MVTLRQSLLLVNPHDLPCLAQPKNPLFPQTTLQTDLRQEAQHMAPGPAYCLPRPGRTACDHCGHCESGRVCLEEQTWGRQRLIYVPSRTEHRGHAAPFTFTVDLRVRGSCAVGMLGVLRRLATVSSGNEKAAVVES
ncbi:hypothetical protein MHYP_G00256310 [Metynnis hypsauchen]